MSAKAHSLHLCGVYGLLVLSGTTGGCGVQACHVASIASDPKEYAQGNCFGPKPKRAVDLLPALAHMHAFLLMLQPVPKLDACLASKLHLSAPAWIASGHVDAGNETLTLLRRPGL